MAGVALERSVALYKENVGNPCLEKEIFRVRSHWQEEGLPRNWYDLPGTGFMINAQMGYLKKDNISHWLLETEADIKGFTLEYLAQGLVFPIHYTIENYEGQPRIINRFHGGGKTLVDTISAKERNGVVKQTVAQKLEPFFVSAPNGSIAVMVSPSGWSGMQDEHGRPISFPDSQTYIWQKKGEDIVGFTIRTDFTLREHAEVLQRLRRLGGQAPPMLEKLEDYVSEVAMFGAWEMPLKIEDIVNIMRDARFDLSGGSLFAYKNRFWGEVYRDLERRNDLWQFDQKTHAYIDEFKRYVLNPRLSQQDIKEALAITVLRISKLLRFEKKTVIYAERNLSYGTVLEDAATLAGCGGGGKSEVAESTGELRMGEVVWGDSKGSLTAQCPTCGQINTRLEGQRINACWNCTSTAIAC